jgi:hypothetical protein
MVGMVREDGEKLRCGRPMKCEYVSDSLPIRLHGAMTNITRIESMFGVFAAFKRDDLTMP